MHRDGRKRLVEQLELIDRAFTSSALPTSRAPRTSSDPGTGLSGTLDGRSRIRGHELRRSSARTGNPAGMKSAAVS